MENTAVAPYTIYAESTPNPDSIKFASNRYLIIDGQVYEFGLEDDTSKSPLAAKLLNFPFISKVFIASNFVTITKTDLIEWEDVIGQMREFLTDYLNNKGEIVLQSTDKEEDIEDNTSSQTPKRDDLEGIDAEIYDILEEYIRPAVESDGGAIHFQSIEDGVVSVVMKGSCSGCPSSTMTLKAGIESLLKEMLPDKVKEVKAING